MSGFSSQGSRPYLKPDCGMVLQRAWNDGLWSSAITMAKQKSKATKDPYYEAVEVAARSQLDNPFDMVAGRDAVEKLLKSKTPFKDSEAIDLYEFATSYSQAEYSKTIGLLRANAVKASPNDKDSAKRSFLACVKNGDWEHAQQIAASMDKNFPKERSFHFRNILTTYLFALSLKDSDPQKSAMFKMLSRRQIEKAKELRDKAPSQSGFPDRAVSNEEEMLLWWKIQLGNAKERSELIPLVTSPENGAVRQLAEGHTTVFQEMMDILEEAGAWDHIFAIGRDIFDKGIPLMVGEENKNVEDVMEQLSLGKPGELTEAQKATMSSAYRSAATDWGFWRQFITAADEQVEAQKALKQTREYLERISKGIKLRSIHKKQLDLANLRILFGRSSHSDSDSVPDGSRIGSLVAYVVTHYRDVACFEDLKGYLEHLSFEELKQLLQQMGEESSKPENDQLKNTMLLTLRLRIHYLFTTSTKYYTPVKGGDGMACNFCDSPATRGRCETCLKSIAQSCIWNHSKGLKQAELQQTLQSEDVDPFSDMTVVGVLCLLKLAYSQAPWESFETAPLAPVEPKLLLQALIWIDAQYHIRARKNMVLALLLTKLYLLVGAVSYAKTLWGSLEVKNVTLDSLGPLFSDRLSSIAPGLWSANGEKQSPMMPYLNYYTNATRKSIPSSLGHAFEHGNVASILQILETDERIKKSCTMISSIVEDLRGTRAVGGKIIIEVRDDPLVESIRPNMTLYNATDFGSLPNHELPSSRPIQDLISIGPGLSAERAHLSLLSEWFMGVVAYREAKEFKPTKAPAVWEADRAVIAEACLNTRQSMENILHKKEVASLLTHPELSYYRLVSSLAAYISQCAGKPWARNASRPESSVAPVVAEELSSQMLRLSALPANGPDSIDVLHAFSSLHATGMLRESALATLVVVRLFERMKSLDAKWETPKWLAEDLKAWGDEVAEAHKVVRDRVKTLNTVVTASGWTGRLAEWAFGDLVRGTKQVSKDADDSEQSDFDMLLYKAIGQGAGVEHAPGQILRSWQNVARGWATVKLD